MAQVNNYEWLNLIPPGWVELARKMIQECETIDPTYHICDLKEKWGCLDIIANCDMIYWREIDTIEIKYEELSANLLSMWRSCHKIFYWMGSSLV